VIPVEVTQTPWHYTTFWDWLDHWQTLIAGSLALLAGFGMVVMTRRIANRQIAASREEADRVIAATREQTEATLKQPKRLFVWKSYETPAKPPHFAPCSKRRWCGFSPRQLGPERPIRRI
jgi:hypothetical protein